MRATAGVIVIGVLGALSAFALPHAGSAANPKLVATVNDNFTITLTDAAGTAVTTLPAGTYDVEVHDNSAFHSFPDGPRRCRPGNNGAGHWHDDVDRDARGRFVSLPV